jgi:hypothetical protein
MRLLDGACGAVDKEDLSGYKWTGWITWIIFITMPKGDKPLSQIWVWDFTAHVSTGVTREILEKQFKEWDCKKWVYQLEKCPTTGSLHYQGRVNLNDKVRVLQGNAMIHTSRTSKEGSKTFSYVMKEDTRVEGPWTDKDKADWIPDWLKTWKPYGWQLDLEAKMDELYSDPDMLRRKIVCVVDSIGNSGKSMYAQYLEDVKGWIDIETGTLVKFQTTGGIIQDLRERRNVPGFVVDLSREVSRQEWSMLADVCEKVKNGKVTDRRHGGKRWKFNPPRMIMFTNKAPPEGIFSADRFWFYNIDPTSQAINEFNTLTQDDLDDDDDDGRSEDDRGVIITYQGSDDDEPYVI